MLLIKICHVFRIIRTLVNPVYEKSEQMTEDNSEKSPFDNDDEEMLLAYEEYEEKQGDIPKPTHAVNENIARDTNQWFGFSAVSS